MRTSLHQLAVTLALFFIIYGAILIALTALALGGLATVHFYFTPESNPTP